MTDAARDPLAAVSRAEAAVGPVLADQLREAVESDDAVAAELADWHAAAGVAEADAVDRAAARQTTVLTNRVRYRAAVGTEPLGDLRETPVRPFRPLPTPTDVDAALDDLEAALAPDAPADLLGVRYADALADDERRVRGQFYTPEPVAGLVTRWALDDHGGGPPRVLDPAAGTGTFPLAAFEHLGEPGRDDADLLAVDVDDVALHVAALRLSAATGGEPADALDPRPHSFFDLHPDDVGPVDAVVGNPPFVRAADLSPDRAHHREHLEAYGPEDVPDADAGDAPYLDGDRALSRRSDASVYFVTHATRFLRPGGRLGLVLPAKWLESDYGVGFRRFLADQYRVHAVVGFGARAFDALVDTVLLLAERREEPGEAGPPDESVRFVRLDGPVDADRSLASLLEAADVDPAVVAPVTRAPDARTVRRPLSTFATARQCSPYLRAPEALLPLLDHPDLVPLGDLADVSRGVTTGANRFFLLDARDRERWDLDPRFLRPALRSVKGFDSRTLKPGDVERAILDVHPFLDGRVTDAGPDAIAAAKGALRDAGHDGLVDYVEHAEASGWHEGRTCQSRRIWFDLGPLPTPDAFVPKLLRERVFTVRNEAGAVPSNAIDCLSVHAGVDAAVLLGVLDSSLSKAMMELWGRDEAGMLQLMTYETRTLPVPDVRAFSRAEARAVASAASSLGAAGGVDDGAQAALDEAVLAALDLDVEADRLRKLRTRLLRRRVDGGERIEVPVA